MSKQKPSQSARSARRKTTVVRAEPGMGESTQRAPSAASIAEGARQRMIAEAAYYRAQKRGFAPGGDLDDWLAAEAEIAQSFLERQPAAADVH